MPHTSRRKNLRPHPKRVLAEGDDGWTTVTTTTTLQSRHLNSSTTALTIPIPSPPPPGLTLPSLLHSHSQHTAVWRASTCFTASVSLLRLSLAGLSSFRITRCVCLGLGSFSDARTQRTALFQLAAILSFVELLDRLSARRPRSLPPVWRLTRSADPKMDVYAQDPAFNTLDCALLAEQNVKAVQHPRAFELIDERTMLFAPHCERAFFFPGIDDGIERGGAGMRAALSVCNSFEDVVEG